ncbi:hypothetical protein [Xanthomonas hortorum]|uniref:Secreted protein n=2 Tax=Xanthomonas hortorum TaxID=56454 RepID=A0A6V7BT90_9XANT|nr:hypothetical protein [Xanthomonas hortorum]MCE4353778.1 hypothetical protein [Xanthomonas hortorum pv. pelargonii]MCM5522678.1 hypothetical protein [Xanthomonas hortorum pv. pelargonii]MCM5535615.1 hypothetical protein [Xanthomonas hortorum pv. pelargonii]MCM5538888.1 hypothetical protein [Xanthomonas hortorum pv. pelargonii]MCM5547034.1 hypothetical protein [Xanthomonas hortorum pv. pelargonii]
MKISTNKTKKFCAAGLISSLLLIATNASAADSDDRTRYSQLYIANVSSSVKALGIRGYSCYPIQPEKNATAGPKVETNNTYTLIGYSTPHCDDGTRVDGVKQDLKVTGDKDICIIVREDTINSGLCNKDK